MGQGTESCDGYDIEYDEYEEGLEQGIWTTRVGQRIHVSKMTYRHLKNTRALCHKLARNATFSSEADKWYAWIDVLDSYIDLKPQQIKKITAPKKPVKGKTVRMKCWCGVEYDAREADLKRGWGMSCSKSHAAIKRDYGRPNATRVG